MTDTHLFLHLSLLRERVRKLLEGDWPMASVRQDILQMIDETAEDIRRDMTPDPDMDEARRIISAPGREPPAMVISDAVAKQLGGPDAVGGTYVRQPDGSYLVFPFDD